MTSAMRRLSSSSPTCGRPSLTLKMMSTSRPCARRYAAVPRVATSLNPSSASWRAIGRRGRLVLVVDADERRPALREMLAGPHLGLRERRPERFGAAHDLAGRFHLGTEQRVDAREPDERKHRRLDEEPGHFEILGQPLLCQASPDHELGGDLGERRAGRLREIRHRSRRARIHFEHVDDVVLDGKLRVHQTDDVERTGDAAGVVADRGDDRLAQLERRHDTGAVARSGCRPARCAP